ncbi:MAG: endo alpha-1,4 polygalactosaminidase [Candidatus Hydrogenedentes bacterium]|nr:endo alpha-1,4 polygalactosaminidase [Candidatus Hydrogenedentota bacterium]
MGRYRTLRVGGIVSLLLAVGVGVAWSLAKVLVLTAGDIDYSSQVDAVDVQLTINAALGLSIDSDQDGLCDAAEVRLGLNPAIADSDNDGVSDFQEYFQETLPPPTRDYRQDMRDFVQAISDYAKTGHPGFVVIPQNGQELLTADGTATGTPVSAYIAALDGVGREDTFYGYDADDVATPPDVRDYFLGFLDLAEQNGIQALVIDYCSTLEFVDQSYAGSAARGYISFAADQRNLTTIPSYPATPYNVNTSDVATLSQARNFLYLLNPELFATKEDFLAAIQGTNYDLFVIDLYFNEDRYTAADIVSLKTKANGGSRLVVAYMSIGEAENYRYYWQPTWATNPPPWLEAENPNWPGNYKVHYWDPEWQSIIFGNPNAYLDAVLAAGFDGVYLDIIDAFEYFESKQGDR